MGEKARETTANAIDETRIAFTGKTTWALLIGAVVLGMWVENVRSQAVEAANTSRELTAIIENVRSDLSEIRGSLTTLMGMQSDVAQASADIRSLESRLDSFDTRLQTMDAWIQTTRERLSDQGFETPPYNPGKRK